MSRSRPAGAARVASVLGIEEERARALLAAMRARFGRRRYRVRLVVFLAATTPGGGLLPEPIRRRALRGLVGAAVGMPGDAMFYLGEADTPAGDACRGLLRS